MVGYDALINLFKSNLTTHHNLRELEKEIKINQIHRNKIFASIILFKFTSILFSTPTMTKKKKEVELFKTRI